MSLVQINFDSPKKIPPTDTLAPLYGPLENTNFNTHPNRHFYLFAKNIEIHLILLSKFRSSENFFAVNDLAFSLSTPDGCKEALCSETQAQLVQQRT